MKVRSKTTTTALLLGIALSVFGLPGAAVANPLLSGYGGPGQGSQVILGGTLLNTPGGGSPGHTAPAGGSTSELTVAATPHPSAAPSRRSGPAQASGAPSGATASKPAATPPASAPPTLFQHASSGTSAGTLGLSSTELLLVLFALAALMLVAAATRQLTRHTS